MKYWSNVYQTCKHYAQIIRRDKIYQNMSILIDRIFLKVYKLNQNDKNTVFEMTVTGTKFTKEAD